MIQVDPDRPLKTYLNLTDPAGKSKSAHETVYGLSPQETIAIIREALIAEMRRRAAEASPA